MNAKNDLNRTRSNSYNSKDHGYETIPADVVRITGGSGMENRKSDGYAHILRKDRTFEQAQKTTPPLDIQIETKPTLLVYQTSRASEKHYETIANNIDDPGYETLTKHQTTNYMKKTLSDYDQNYEMLMGPYAEAGSSDDGYAKVLEKKRLELDEMDVNYGYSKVRGEEDPEDVEGAVGGYSTINKIIDKNHNYASIREKRKNNEQNEEQHSLVGTEEDVSSALETESDHYARINEQPLKARSPELPITSPTSNSSTYFGISSANSSTTITTNSTLSSRQTPSSSQYDSFTGSDTDPNYESVCYLSSPRENPYERLQPDNSESLLSSPHTPEVSTASTTLSSVATANKKAGNGHVRHEPEVVDVDDFIQV